VGGICRVGFEEETSERGETFPISRIDEEGPGESKRGTGGPWSSPEPSERWMP